MIARFMGFLLVVFALLSLAIAPVSAQTSDDCQGTVEITRTVNDTFDICWYVESGVVDPALMGHNIYRDGNLVASYPLPTWELLGVSITTPGDYAYTVTAYGDDGIESEHSNVCIVHIIAPIPAPGCRVRIGH